MKIKATAFGTVKQSLDMRNRTGFFSVRAEDEIESCIVAALYQGLATDRFPALTRSITAAAKKLQKIRN